MRDTHGTAPTRFVAAKGIRFAYRKFGTEAGVPLLFLQHFRGGLDHWDPVVTDGLAANRPVILLNNTGVGSSSGETPDLVDTMAQHVADLVDALGLTRLDVLGFSLGGYVAQSFALQNPDLIRRLVLVGTGPRGGEPPQDASIPAKRRGDRSPHRRSTARGVPVRVLLAIRTQPSGRKGILGTATRRKDDVDPPSSPKTMAT